MKKTKTVKYGDIVGREVHGHVMAHWNEGNQTCACLYCKVFGHKTRFYAGLKSLTKFN